MYIQANLSWNIVDPKIAVWLLDSDAIMLDYEELMLSYGLSVSNIVRKAVIGSIH